MPRRLTREEKRQRTRSSLLSSAAKVFACRGMDRASIDEVAEEAGFTKGAFYANFKSKEELFLAMLDERFATHMERVERLLETDAAPEEQARAGGAEFVRWISADPEWERLFFEFAAYAARNDDFRAELVTRYRSLREALATAFGRYCESHDIASPIPIERVALMTFAMANGFALEQLLEPEAVEDDVYSTMLLVFFTGLRALAEQPSQA
jgi:AcrR family transcriptional regulator